MAEPSRREATFIGQVTSVRGGMVQVRLRDTPTTLVMVDGSAHRIGQLGAFVRIPLGYTQLYGVTTQVGADVVPSENEQQRPILETDEDPRLIGFRWMMVALFGEAVEGRFDRGVGQYPTVGDEVHVVTARDLDVIYAQRASPADAVIIGRVAGFDGVPAALRVSALVSRHSCVVGSTGAGKSNLVAVLLRALAGEGYTSARVLVVDPHGEYASALPENSRVITTGADAHKDALRVPYWALPFDELMGIAMGALHERDAEHIRERVRQLKVEAAQHLAIPPPTQAITADSPIAFSIRRLWFELEDVERATFSHRSDQTQDTREQRIATGDAETLVAPEYPPATSYNTPPYYNSDRRGIRRQLDFMRARLLDSRFAFMFEAADEWHPSEDGRVKADLDLLFATWVGGPQPVTILDVSGLPSEVLDIVVGTMLNITYSALFWGMKLPVGGKHQPLLVVLDEAHRFLPGGADTSATRACSRIAKEGRKYGVGLMTVTQRPSDIDSAVLSQCGTMVALRVTNGVDRGAVTATVPDDLGGLTALLPSLRTGEALVLGDALQVPSRVRIHKAPSRPVGDDPNLPAAWQTARPDPSGYSEALARWRAQSTGDPPHERTDGAT
jgi:uncharacterized protein